MSTLRHVIRLIPLSMLTITPLLTLEAKAEIDLRLSGFGSIGALTTNSDKLGFRRDLSDPKASYQGEINISSLSLLGLQANLEFSENVEFVGQIVLREQPVQNADTILKIASLNWQANDKLEFRLGRSAQRFYMLSDSRHIGFANLWTMPVQEFYAPTGNNYLDGLTAHYRLDLAGGLLTSNFAYGETVVVIEDEISGASKLSFNNSFGVSLEYEKGDWLTRISWTESSNGKDWPQVEQAQQALLYLSQIWPGAISLSRDLSIENKTVRYTNAGVYYDNGKWSVISEIGHIKSESLLLPTTNNAYISLGRHIDLFTPYIIFASSQTETPDQLTNIPPETGPMIAGFVDVFGQGWDQDTFSVGTRWDFHFNMALKAQWDYKQVEKQGMGLWFRGKDGLYPQQNTNVQVISIRWDFTF
ncbi:hypothetical protein [Agaribacterium sp. ZY112]|uniref:hypothetical protein n=1 Tax=Agaribacterium sp. ZY112 TaxID=3233574 RepID=UPI0035232C20